MKQLFEGYEFITPSISKRASERGSLIDYFTYKANQGRTGRRDVKGKPYKPLTKTFIAMQLQKFRIPDLYYLKSVSEDYERRTGNWGKFYWAIVRMTETTDGDILRAKEDLGLSTR